MTTIHFSVFGKLLFFVLVLFFLSFDTQTIDKISFVMETSSLHKGKLVKVEAEVFYENPTGKMLTRYVNPSGKVMIANRVGEVTIYDENDNTVDYRQGEQYSTNTGTIQFFLMGKTQDLGLSDFGFQQSNVNFEDGLMVTEWFPPPSLYHLYNKIKIVHENYLPVHVAYYDAQRNLVKKVYYSQYQNFSDVSVPTRITEFEYVANDSIINRILFKDIKTNRQANSPWFQFEIPENAKTRP
ncbi:MAG: hypothetical protein ACLFQS_01865 [Bacteroidales bacterium]